MQPYCEINKLVYFGMPYLNVLQGYSSKVYHPGGTAFLRNSDGGRVSIISASKVGGGLANISSEGGMKFNIVIYIFCTAFYSIDSHCIQAKLKNLKVNHIIFAIP